MSWLPTLKWVGFRFGFPLEPPKKGRSEKSGRVIREGLSRDVRLNLQGIGCFVWGGMYRAGVDGRAYWLFMRSSSTLVAPQANKWLCNRWNLGICESGYCTLQHKQDPWWFPAIPLGFLIFPLNHKKQSKSQYRQQLGCTLARNETMVETIAFVGIFMGIESFQVSERWCRNSSIHRRKGVKSDIQPRLPALACPLRRCGC